MEYTLLNDGQTKISKLSIGTWAFSGATVWGESDDVAAVETVKAALDCGINLFDTAEAYGNGHAEIVLGKALKGKRSKAIIATKVYSNHLNYQQIITACESSLKRLDMDYIDLLQIHWPNSDISVDESFEAFDKLKRDGKVRLVSVCNHGIHALDVVDDKKVVLNQLPYSLVWRLVEYHLNPSMEKNSIPIWAYSPLGQGLLTGKYKSLEDVPLNRRATRIYNSKWGMGRHSDSGYEEVVFEFLNQLQKICAETGYSMQSLAFHFLKSRSNMGSVLVGARNIQQLYENVRAYNTDVPQNLIRVVDILSLELRNKMGENADLWENRLNKYHEKGRFY